MARKTTRLEMQNHFLVTHQAWQKLTAKDRKQLTALKRKPRSVKRLSLWMYAHSLGVLQQLASGKLNWHEVDTGVEFLFDLAQTRTGKSKDVLLESAKDFLLNLPENAWLTYRFGRDRTITSGLSPIDTLPHNSHFDFWHTFLQHGNYDFSDGGSLALAVIEAHDLAWLWVRIRTIQNVFLVYAVAHRYAKRQTDLLAIASIPIAAFGALGALMLCEKLKSLETATWAELNDLRPLTDVRLDLRSIRRHWHATQASIESALNKLVGALSPQTRNEVLIEILVWTIGHRDPQYDRRPGTLERIAQSIVGKAIANQLNSDSSLIAFLVQSLKRIDGHSISLLELVAKYTTPAIAVNLRKMLIQHLESRLEIPEVFSENTSQFYGVEREQHYLKFTVSALVHHTKTNALSLSDWFHRCFSNVPTHTEDRFH